jgi:ATP-dependent Lon protease
LKDLHEYGTYARVVQTSRAGDNTYRIGLEGLGRFRLQELDGSLPYLRVRGEWLEETARDPREAGLLAEALREQLTSIQKSGGALGEIPERGTDPGLLADVIAAGLELELEPSVQLLASTDASDRLRKVVELLGERATTAKLRDEINKDVREQFGKQQREAILREQLRAIKKQLGDDGGGAEFDALRQKLDEAELPEDVRTIVEREFKRLDSAKQGPEGHVIRTYLEWIADLPWSKRAEANVEIDKIAEQLDADHFGLDDVKKRILEHMAVCNLSGNPRGTILALVGPPGVGKTSLGQSIADATGRPLVRIALGGVRDEAEIRGHRRTYVGALPGRVIHALRKAKVKNPVVLLDEIDKLGTGWGGSPEAALLEVLDPEQNKNFTDHYLETPFDLSEVMFIATANTLETLSAPLRDRLEIVELGGYTEAEKVQIARKHLIPKRLRDSGVPEDVLAFGESALSSIIADYTREAGVRQLDREIMRVTRRVALEYSKRRVKEPELHIEVDANNVTEYLGKRRFFAEVAERTAVPGVATGLAWTPVGGDILFIETTQMPGKGQLEITGKLGDVMKESARAALSYVRSHSRELGIDSTRLDKSDLHIHVPAGAVPKDGPSAGVTIFTAFTSLLTGRRVRSDTAMTGECTLRGRVLPVGGIKAKVLAAHRAGIRRVVLPEKNQRDLDEIPQVVLRDLEVIFASDMSEVLAAALEPIADSLEGTSGGLLGGGSKGDSVEHLSD